MDSPFLDDDLDNLDNGTTAPPVETWQLSPELFGNELWILRLCFLPQITPAMLEANLNELNVVALNAKAIAGRRHLIAGTNALVRDFQARRGELLP
jgi:hypothetical protein